MITRQQRKFYAVIVGILFGLGMILYGGLAFFSDMTRVIVYAVLGGILLGGLASGIILFGRFMKQRRSTALIVLACVLAPVTMLVIASVGVYGVIPYYIYNMVVLKRTKEGDAPASTIQTTKHTKKAVWIVVLCIIAVLMIASITYKAIRSSMISQEMYAKTGYAVGSPEHFILTHYYNFGILEDGEYEYIEQDDVLFVLVKRDGLFLTDIHYGTVQGNYTTYKGMNRYIFINDSDLMREDLGKLLTDIKLEGKGDSYALMFTTDSRTDDAPIVLSLTDENGVSIQKMNDGNYTVYCDVIHKNNKDYNLIVSYKGDTYTLLTYEDIAAFNITNKS